MIELRRKVYSDRDGYDMIASSVTDPAWLDAIPTGRPVMVVAEGLLPYLTETEVRQLLSRITERFDGGEVVFDVVSQWAPRVSKLFEWGIRDGRELAGCNPRLTFVEQTSALAGYAKIPLTPQRVAFRIFHALPIIRDYDRLYRFTF